MKESIGSTASLNIMLAFIAIVFAFLAATLSYYKAYKVNNVIANAIEKYEGYNNLSEGEIASKLTSIGYQQFQPSQTNCPKTKKFDKHEYNLVSRNNGICVYVRYKKSDANVNTYQYGVVSYMTISLPIISNFIKIPVKTTTNELYGCYGDNTKFTINVDGGRKDVNCVK